MLKLLISLIGIAAGAGWGYIAKEEIVLGKKYLELLRYVLSFLILSAAGFYFILSQQWVLLGASLLVWILLLFLSLRWKWQLTEVAVYALFGSWYYFLPPSRILIASLIFLYGLPIGSLLWLEYENSQKRPRRND